MHLMTVKDGCGKAAIWIRPNRSGNSWKAKRTIGTRTRSATANGKKPKEETQSRLNGMDSGQSGEQGPLIRYLTGVTEGVKQVGI
jgi:hypothetical protein